MDTLVRYELASRPEGAREQEDGAVEFDCSAARLTLRDVDQREVANALMASALRTARPDEVEVLKAGYALALERATSTR